MHALNVRREVLFPKRRLEVLAAVKMTALPLLYCFLLYEYLIESTNNRYKSATGALTTLAYPKTEL